MVSVAALASSLQTLFTVTAAALGRTTGLIRRQRDLTAADFAQTLVFGWIDQSHATLESFSLRLDLSAQALHQRMGPAARAFFQGLIAEALRRVQAARPTRLGLLRRFPAVVVEDSSIVTLPADLAAEYRGHGGSDLYAGKAGLKVSVRWELLSGPLLSLECVAATVGDPTLAATADDLPAGALHLADQGFFDAGRWAGYGDRLWISRVPSGVAVAVGGVWRPLSQWLLGLTESSFDGAALLGESQGLPCRLTAQHRPAEVAATKAARVHASQERTRAEPTAIGGMRLACAGDERSGRAVDGEGIVAGVPLPLANRVAVQAEQATDGLDVQPRP